VRLIDSALLASPGHDGAAGENPSKAAVVAAALRISGLG
jgi:hypothetical protein